jgi:Domain of unknown function (DUF4265)
MGDKPVKVYVHLEVDDSGYPPVSSEFLWCIPTTQGSYIVDNIPFYAREISMGDEVTADVFEGLLAFRSVLKPSANSTIRVFVKQKEAQERIISRLHKFGCNTEAMEGTPLIAVSLPPDCHLQEALAFMDEEAGLGTVAIEESSVRYQ